MLLDQYRTLERASCELALGVSIRVLGHSTLLLFDANQHLREEKAL